MTQDSLWALVHQTDLSAEPFAELQARWPELSDAEQHEVVAFIEQQLLLADTPSLREIAALIAGESDDCASVLLDLRCFLLSLGQERFAEILQDPEGLSDDLEEASAQLSDYRQNLEAACDRSLSHLVAEFPNEWSIDELQEKYPFIALWHSTMSIGAAFGGMFDMFQGLVSNAVFEDYDAMLNGSIDLSSLGTDAMTVYNSLLYSVQWSHWDDVLRLVNEFEQDDESSTELSHEGAFRRAQAYAATGRLSEALTTLQSATEPDSFDYAWRVVQLYGLAEEKDHAIQWAYKAFEIQGPEGWPTLANILIDHGQWTEAAEIVSAHGSVELDEVAKLFADYAKARMALQQQNYGAAIQCVDFCTECIHQLDTSIILLHIVAELRLMKSIADLHLGNGQSDIAEENLRLCAPILLARNKAHSYVEELCKMLSISKDQVTLPRSQEG